jgi:glycine cleavage system aminomethyltransferase T
MGYVAKEIADKQYGWSIDILGETLPASPQTEPLFDPTAERMRG